MKRKKKPTTPPMPSCVDMGPQTAMQMLNADTEPVPDDKNGSRRKFRRDAIDRTKGLSKRQYEAGKRLRNSWEALGKGPAAIKEIQVDSSPKPDANIGILIDRQSWFIHLYGVVPRDMRSVVDHVVIQDRTIWQGLARNGKEARESLAILQVALDLVGNRAGL